MNHHVPTPASPRVRSLAGLLVCLVMAACGAGPGSDRSAAGDAAKPAAPPARIADAAAEAGRADSSAVSPVPVGTHGELTFDFAWTSRLVSNREFKDVTVLDRRTTITCPITAAAEDTTSAIAGDTSQQAEANARRAEAAAADVAAAVPAETVAKAEAIEKKIKACRKAGGSEGECGMQAVAALQADPGVMESMAAAGQAKPSTASRFQPWFNEGCRGSMTVADQRQLDDPTIPGPEPVVHTTGRQSIDTRDTLVTVETDLARGSTRYMIVAPQADGFPQEAGYGEPEKRVTAAAMPVAVVVAGPFAGGVQAGQHRVAVEGGEVRISWSFRTQ